MSNTNEKREQLRLIMNSTKSNAKNILSKKYLTISDTTYFRVKIKELDFETNKELEKRIRKEKPHATIFRIKRT